MTRKADIITKDGQEFVETEDHIFGLGLKLPRVKTQAFPTMAAAGQPLLPMDEIKNRISSETFEFGRKWFDSSWITNQNGYGSCASYAATSALMRARKMSGQDRKTLSGDYLYSLVNGGRDQGSMLDDNMHALMNRGAALAETVPLGGIYRNKYNTAKADKEALRFRGHELFAIPDEQSMATALALRMPVVIAIHVGRNWRNVDKDGVLIGDDGVGNHSEGLDDIRWNSVKGRFEYRKFSSHKLPYCWVTWEDHLKTPARYHQFYAVPSAIQDPLADNPEGSEVDDDQPLATPILTMQSSSGCHWCREWESTEWPKAVAAKWKVQKGNLNSSKVPAFSLRVGEKEYEWLGFKRFEEIEKQAADMR